MFNQTQYENPKLYQFKVSFEAVLNEVKNELQRMKVNEPGCKNIKPWINQIRDGLTISNIELLETNEIIPMTQLLDETFKDGYNFIYSNYIKEYDNSLVSVDGQFAKVQGQSIDEKLNFEYTKQILYSIVIKPKTINGKLM